MVFVPLAVNCSSGMAPSFSRAIRAIRHRTTGIVWPAALLQPYCRPLSTVVAPFGIAPPTGDTTLLQTPEEYSLLELLREWGLDPTQPDPYHASL